MAYLLRTGDVAVISDSMSMWLPASWEIGADVEYKQVQTIACMPNSNTQLLSSTENLMVNSLQLPVP